MTSLQLGIRLEKCLNLVQFRRLHVKSTCNCAALAARAGAEHVKPALQRIYMTRASAYRDALKSFVEGYQEGVAEVMAKASQAEPATSRQRFTEADEQTTRSSPAEEARKDKLPF